jgi:hypothetical protein
MLYRPATPPFPRERMSPGAIATATAIHAGLLWLLLQYSPLVPTVRYVVYQYVRPISPAPEANRAITIRPKAATSPTEAPAVFSNTPESSVPMQATAQLPETVQPQQKKPAPRAVEPKPIPKRRTETAPQRAAEPVPAPPAPPVPMPPAPAPAPEIAPTPVAPPVPIPAPPEPAPVPAPEPVPLPTPAPAPAPVAAPPPIPAPAPEPVPAPVPAEPPVAAPPAPAPVAPPVAPPAVQTPAAPAPTQRLQGPVIDVPVAPGSPGAGSATPVLVPQPAPGGGWGAPIPAPPRAALPPAPVLAPAIPPHPGPYRVAPQRSVSEMANAQLRREKKDPLAADVEDASVDDCLRASDKPSVVSGLLNAPVVAARALTGKCAK